MKDTIIDFSLDLTIHGDGSSLWAKGRSKGDWKITRGTLRGCAIGDPDYPGGIWELQLFGPKTRWDHYTDDLIEKEVNAALRETVAKRLGFPVKAIGWSEQGMQPDNGWSFDVCLAKLTNGGATRRSSSS